MTIKRTNGEGSIRKRKDGRWEGRYYDPNLNKQKSIYAKTKSEVRKKLTSIQSQIDAKTYLSRDNTTFDELIRYYFTTVKQYLVKPQTLSGYRLRYHNLFEEKLGHREIQKITEEELQRIVNNWVDEGKSKTYIKSGGVIIKEVLEYAVQKRIIQTNPMAYVRYNIGAPEKEKRELSEEELNWFFRGVKERYGYLEILFELLLYTGMRVSELCSLRWRDISSDYKVLEVKNNLTRYKDKTGKYIQDFTTPKTEGSKRVIPIVEHLKPKLIEYRQECCNQFERYGLQLTNDNLVFIPDISEGIERPYNRSIISNIIRTTIKYLEKRYNVFIDDFTPHYFRHKFVSVAMRQQMPLRDLMEITGHTEVKTVLKYAHTQQEHLIKSMSNISKMF